MMRTFLIAASLLMSASGLLAQQDSSKSRFFLSAGAKYTPLEYLGGPSLGLYYQGRSQKFSIGLRKDYIFSIGRPDPSIKNYQLTNYCTYNYFDLFYHMGKKVKTGIGLGWIYDGKGESIKLNNDYGYPSLTVSYQYKISWFYTEIRGDIPLEKRNAAIDQGHLFPVSVALLYEFTPRREN